MPPKVPKPPKKMKSPKVKKPKVKKPLYQRQNQKQNINIRINNGSGGKLQQRAVENYRTTPITTYPLFREMYDIAPIVRNPVAVEKEPISDIRVKSTPTPITVEKTVEPTPLKIPKSKVKNNRAIENTADYFNYGRDTLGKEKRDEFNSDTEFFNTSKKTKIPEPFQASSNFDMGISPVSGRTREQERNKGGSNPRPQKTPEQKARAKELRNLKKSEK
jgi:hypothetical protein